MDLKVIVDEKNFIVKFFNTVFQPNESELIHQVDINLQYGMICTASFLIETSEMFCVAIKGSNKNFVPYIRNHTPKEIEDFWHHVERLAKAAIKREANKN